jgi:photosystem II stability/assembly factor-like uncharacterized protein
VRGYCTFMTTVLLVGTKKGLFVGRSEDPGKWEVTGPHFSMNAVYGAAVDVREGTPRLLAGADSEHWGPGVFTSDDLGEHWDEPAEGALTFPADSGVALTRVWALQPGTADQPGRVWAGTEPGALFRSDNGGHTFTLVEGLWERPERPQWGEGYGGQAVHTVVVHPARPDRVLVAVSTGGVYRSEDGGATWSPSNDGIPAPFLPDPQPKFGQCVHKMAGDAVDPDRLYLQNHGGVFRSDDGGSTWSSIAGGLPAEFGFPVVAHPTRTGTAYLFPLVADHTRLPPDARCRVYRTEDAGETWQALDTGLPSGDFWQIVLRDAMCTDGGDGVYFGTRGGQVYASQDAGDSWAPVMDNLPDVLCVRAVSLS